MFPVVVLTEEDREAARACARRMVSDAQAHGAMDRFGKDDLAAHAHGALAEIAFARFLGVPWECHSLDWAKADVAGYEVRAIPPRQRTVYIKAKPNDPDERKVVVVLLLANYTEAMVLGWMTAGEIRSHVKESDWGHRGAKANMLEDLRHLHYDFPEGYWNHA